MNDKTLAEYLGRVEDAAIDFIAIFAPWLGPIPSAYLVGKACEAYLGWHWAIAIIAAVAVESIGVVSVVTSLRLFEWNETKNKTDPAAPFALSVLLVAVYFIVTIGLTVLLDVFPELARYAPAIFPILAAVGAVNIAIKNGQRRREEAKATKKAKRSKAHSKPPRSTKSQPKVNPGSTVDGQPAVNLRELTPGQLRVYEVYQDNPGATYEEIGQQLGISKQAVSKHIKAMNGLIN